MMSDKQTAKKDGFLANVKNTAKRTTKFFTDTRSEMKKIVWPTRKQIVNNTIIVLVVVAVVGVFLFGLDTVMKYLLDLALMGR